MENNGQPKYDAANLKKALELAREKYSGKPYFWGETSYEEWHQRIEEENLRMELADFQPNQGPGGYQRIYLDHKNGGFKFSGDHPPVDYVTVIPLGLIKQRRLWLEKDNGAKCGCKSADAEQGRPTHLFPRETYEATIPINIDEQMPSCTTCPFARYDSRPKCQEKWYVPVLMSEDKYDINTIYIMEFSQSGIAILKQWFKDIIENGKRPWDIFAEIKSKKRINGNNTFMIPEVASQWDVAGPTYEDEEYVKALREVKAHLDTDAMRGSIYDAKPTDKFGAITMGNKS